MCKTAEIVAAQTSYLTTVGCSLLCIAMFYGNGMKDDSKENKVIKSSDK